MTTFAGRKSHAEPVTLELSPTKPYLFDLHNHIARANRILIGVVVLLVVALCALAIFTGIINARPPMVIVKDRLLGEPAQIVMAGEAPPYTEADARVFFINMAKLRHGWNSATVGRDIVEFQLQSHVHQREADNRFFQEMVPVDAERSNAKRARLEAYAAMNVQNILILPNELDRIRCKGDTDKHAWHCEMRAKLVTQPLIPSNGSTTEINVTILATLLEVKHTVGTPYGLLVGRLQLTQDPREDG